MTQDELIKKLREIGIQKMELESEYTCEDGCCHDPAELIFHMGSGLPIILNVYQLENL